MKQHRKLHTCLLETLSHHRESQARINWDMNHTQILPLFYCCGSPQTTHWCMCTLNPEHWSEHTPSRTHSLSLSHANTHTLSLPHTLSIHVNETFYSHFVRDHAWWPDSRTVHYVPRCRKPLSWNVSSPCWLRREEHFMYGIQHRARGIWPSLTKHIVNQGVHLFVNKEFCLYIHGPGRREGKFIQFYGASLSLSLFERVYVCVCVCVCVCVWVCVHADVRQHR